MKRLCLVLLLAAAACDDARETEPDELTIVVKADRRDLESQESLLHDREEALHKEKARLDSHIADLARGLKAAADAEQRLRLEAELRRQQDLEGQITVRATALQAQKNEVEAKKQVLDSDVQWPPRRRWCCCSPASRSRARTRDSCRWRKRRRR